MWAAELATALAGSEARGRVYVVEPTGPFEDDPNVTNKKYHVAIFGAFGAGFESIITGEPRMFGARLRYRFGD